MLGEDKVIKEIEKIEDDTIKQVCDLLKGYTQSIDKYLISFVSNLCDVEPRVLLFDTKKIKSVHARWFYWYVYRYMTNASYEEIAVHSAKYRKFAHTCVCNAIAQMAIMVSSEGIWMKRWSIMKTVVDIIKKNHYVEQELFEKTVTLKVSSPQGINVELKKE